MDKPGNFSNAIFVYAFVTFSAVFYIPINYTFVSFFQCGGIRMWKYDSMREYLHDGIRLSLVR